MANIKSSQKKNRQRITHEARNQARKSAMRTAVKRVRTAIGKKDLAGAKDALSAAIPLIDRAASRGTIKRGTASRAASRLTVAVARIKA